MTDSRPPSPGSRGQPPPRPTWVNVSLALAALIAVVLMVILVSGGEHGPGRHLGSPPVGTATTTVTRW